MCSKCNGNCSGLGSSIEPVQKVETYTAPVVTFDTTLPTAPIYQDKVYVPEVQTSNIWADIGSAISGVANFITTNKQNNLLAQQSTVSPSQYTMNQVPQQQVVQQDQNQNNNSIDTATILKGGLLAAVAIGGIYLLKK